MEKKVFLCYIVNRSLMNINQSGICGEKFFFFSLLWYLFNYGVNYVSFNETLDSYYKTDIIYKYHL